MSSLARVILFTGACGVEGACLGVSAWGGGGGVPPQPHEMATASVGTHPFLLLIISQCDSILKLILGPRVEMPA